MLEHLTNIAALQSVDAIVDASGWWELREDSFHLLRRYLKHGRRDAAMYELALQHHPEVVPDGVSMTDMRIGAMCHDIAKPWVNDESSFWDKRGLSPDDVRLIQQHPSASYQLLCEVRARGVAVPAVALVIARNHHEKLDGSGYPRGLSDGQIPGFVQLFSVVDQFVGIAEFRAYHEKAWSLSDIETLMTQKRKFQFNQVYVTSVIALIRNGEHLGVPELADLDNLKVL